MKSLLDERGECKAIRTLTNAEISIWVVTELHERAEDLVGFGNPRIS